MSDPNTGGGAGTGPGGGAGTGPNKPPPPPPPTKSLDDRIFAAVDEIRADFDLPARRDQILTRASAVAATGGPGKTTCFPAGDRPTPGSADALCGASSESDGAVVAPVAGASFRLPEPPFVIGVGVPYDALPPVDARPFRERAMPPGLPRSRRAAWRMATAPIEDAST